MSTWGDPPEEPGDWDPDATSAVPLGPEPEPTGAGRGGGAGGWGPTPQVEPFAIAALVWGIVSLAIPIIATVVALVLAARAADLIRRSQGARTGTGYVTAARVLAGVGIALWAIGLILWLALRNDDTSHHVAVPTSPPVTTAAAPSTTTTTRPLPTTTAKPPVTSTRPAPTISVIPPPTTVKPPPTVAPTTAGPAPTTAPVTTKAPVTSTKAPATTTTTTPAQREAKRLTTAMLGRLGSSNRGVPSNERVAVSYTPRKPLSVTWAINNGTPPPLKGTPTCTSPPPPVTTTSSTSSSTTTTSTTSTSTTSTTTPKPSQFTTSQRARYEARQILQTVKNELSTGRLHIEGVQLVGRYPIAGQGDVDVVQAFYTNSTVMRGGFPYTETFDVPPAAEVQCINPAFG